MTSPTVSVIIPVYNGANFLREAVESALAQTHRPHEIIVMDDGSSDGSYAIAQELAVTAMQQSNAGVSAARNRAVERSTGEMLAFLDCDDLWLPEKLETQIALLVANPEADYAVSSIHYFLEPGSTAPAWFHLNSPPEGDISYPPSTWLVPRRVWDVVGPFNEARRYVEDIDWLARANDLGFKLVSNPVPLVDKRVRDDSLTGNVPEIKKGMLLALRESAQRKRQNARDDA